MGPGSPSCKAAGPAAAFAQGIVAMSISSTPAAGRAVRPQNKDALPIFRLIGDLPHGAPADCAPVKQLALDLDDWAP